MAEKIEGAIGWNDEIEDDGSQFVLLAPGDYEFTVEDMKAEKYPGSAKIPANVNVARITLRIPSEDGIAQVKADLILYTSLEWKLSEFFRSIGQKKHGEKLKPNWKAVKGSSGKVRIKNGSFTGKDGKTHQTNEVERFLDPDAVMRAPVKAEAPKDDFLDVSEEIPEEDRPF